MKKEIFVRFDIPGIHHWPEAPEGLEFIRSPHRHDFKFEVGINIVHNERQLEFFQCQHKCAMIVMDMYPTTQLVVDFGTRSCETIAEELIKQLPLWVTYVEVSEDGENGARIFREEI